MTPLLSPHLLTSGFDLPLTLAVLAGIGVLHFLYLTLRPLLEEGQISSDDWERIRDESIALLHRRDRVIAELKDLEFEAAMNKVDDHDLSLLKHKYESEALALIEQLDRQAADYQDQINAEVDAKLKAAEARRTRRESDAQPKSSKTDTPSTDTPSTDEGETAEGAPTEVEMKRPQPASTDRQRAVEGESHEE
jgi:hypothetical protein